MTSSHGRSGNLSENFFRNSREFAVALKLAFLNLERLPFGVMSVQDVPRPRLSRWVVAYVRQREVSTIM